MKQFRLLLVLPLLLIMGCSDPYRACVKASADIGIGIGQGMHTVNDLRQSGVISSAEEANVLNYLEYANIGNKAFMSCSQMAHTSGSKVGTFTSCAQTFNSALNNPTSLALIKVSNAGASQEISTIVNGITTGVTAVVTALGGK